MKRIADKLVVAFLLSLGGGGWLMAQTLPVDRFLARVAANPVGDQAEKDQSAEVFRALNIASPAEVERELPTVLQYARSGNGHDARGYAAFFLFSISMRTDGGDLLSSKSEAISSLLLDADPGIQKVAVAITDYVIGNPTTNKQPYLSALKAAIQRPQIPQDVVLVGMIQPLLTFASGDPDAVKSVLAFVRRDDLTPSIRSDLVHQLGGVPGLPEELTQYLVRRLDDPDPHVRAMALVSYADSTTAYHALGKDSVQRIANNPEEIPGVRELAKEAMAGKINLNPNYDFPPLVLDPVTGAAVQKPNDQ